MSSCYLCHLLHSYVFSLFSDSSASLYYLIRLIWRVYQMSENRRRFASKVGHLWYLMSLSQWFGEVSVCPSGPTVDCPHCLLRRR